MYVKKQKKSTPIPPIHVYMSIINNRLVFKIRVKIRDGYIELQRRGTINLSRSTHKKTTAEKSKENEISLEVFEIALFQRNLVDNQYQQRSEVLHTFTLNKSRAYLFNVKLNNIVF